MRLGVQEVVVSECGHSFRVMKWLCESRSNNKNPFRVTCVQEVMARFLKKEGRLAVKEGHIEEPLTYHDPCQLARNGGILEEPRYILRHIASDFRELTPNRERNWCCGGGGGLQVEPDLDDFRISTAQKKVEQIRKRGAKIVVAPCDNCRRQLEDLNNRHDLRIRVCSVIRLFADALVIPGSASRPRSSG